MEQPVVLVVESETLIRMSAVQIVRDAGYGVVDAANADMAIAILENRKDIRAIFTDVHMSGSMDGLRLAQAVRHRWPPIHLIVTSGLAMSPAAEFPANWRFILKPYAAEHVEAALHDVFGTHPAPRLVTHNGLACGKVA